MALGDLSGASRTNPRNPAGQGICDRTGFALQHNRMQRQFQWGGAKLFDTGYLVRPQSLDKPQDQYRSLILPGDPQPLVNPRPDYWQTPPYPANTPGNQGFQQYELTVTQSETPPGGGGFGQFAFGITPFGGGSGAIVTQNYPVTEGGALAAIATFSGIPTPPILNDYTSTIALANITQAFVPANPTRSWLAVYSPGGQQFAFNLATAVWGLATNLMVGPGQAYFAATALGFGTVYQGAITVISLQQGAPVWAWDA